MKVFQHFLLTALFVLAATLGLSAQDAAVKHDKMGKMAAEPALVQLTQTTGEYTVKGLTLAPGDYVFEISNAGVDKGLGFYLQAADDSQVPNSGVAELVQKNQSSRTGVVTLTPGTYTYSCPLNPTPHYTITVE